MRRPRNRSRQAHASALPWRTVIAWTSRLAAVGPVQGCRRPQGRGASPAEEDAIWSSVVPPISNGSTADSADRHKESIPIGGACSTPLPQAGEVGARSAAGEGGACGTTRTLGASRLDLSREERARCTVRPLQPVPVYAAALGRAFIRACQATMVVLA